MTKEKNIRIQKIRLAQTRTDIFNSILRVIQYGFDLNIKKIQEFFIKF